MLDWIVRAVIAGGLEKQAQLAARVSAIEPALVDTARQLHAAALEVLR